MSLVAAAPAAPAAGALGITAGLILVCFAVVALYGIQYGYEYTFGAFIRRLADMVEDIWVVGGSLANALNALDSWVMKQIGNGLASMETAAGRLFGALAWLVRETGDAIAAFGADVHDAIAGLVYGEIPTQIQQRTDRLRRDVATTRSGLRTRLEEEARVRSRGIDRVGRDLARERLARERGIDYIAGRINTLVLPRIRALEAGLSDLVGYTRRTLAARLRAVERAAAAGVVGGVAVAAITRLFPYWQCTNVRRFNRALCRTPVGDLNALLGLLSGVAILALAVDPRTLARAAELVTEGLEGIIRETALR